MRAAIAIALLLLGCSRSDSPAGVPDAAPAASPAVPGALLPDEGHTRSGSAASLPTEGAVDGKYLADVDSCGSCHPDILAQQQGSAHAFASFNNPIYRLSVERLRTDVGVAASVACAGCHDAALLVDGAMAVAVSPSDPRAHNGVSCRLCHGIETASREGNASFVLGGAALPLPITGDAESLARHKAAARPPAQAELCGSCHQSFLSEATGNGVFLAGQSEMSAWADSPYAGSGAARVDSVEPKNCVQCHMAKVDATMDDAAMDSEGMVSSHYFLGAHTWLAAMRKDGEQLARTKRFLEGAATIDAIGGLSVDFTGERSGEIVVDIVVRNTGVGHRFPSGVRDAANTWIEVEILAADKSIVLRSSPGASTHRLRAYLADDNGVLLNARETHRFAALIADHTIAPRDVAVTRYRGVLPRGQGVGHIRARLLHQSRGQELAIASCAESSSVRGRAFANARRSLGREKVDACIRQPITTIAEVTRVIGDKGRQSFARSYEHGLGLLHEVQERVDGARPSLQAALALAAGDPKREAMALVALAELEGRLGRADESLLLLRRAGLLAPKSPAVFAKEGDALARVWRWRGAVRAYAKAIALVPGNASLWRRYAIALGSTGSQGEALLAAQRGLRLLPRDADLLRVQALALRSLDHADAAAAMEAYLVHRGLDNVGSIRLRCANESTQCAREALPVHEHALQQVNRR